MPELAVGLESLAFVILFTVALGLALTGKYLATAVASPVAGVLRLIPSFGTSLADGLEAGVESLIIEPLDDVASAAESQITKGLNGILGALELGLGLTILLADGIRLALTYLWNHALVPLVHSITDVISRDAAKALSLVEAVPGETERDIATALTAVEGFTARELDAAETLLRGEIAAAKAAALEYADDAVATLRAAETAAFAHAAAVTDAAIEGVDDAFHLALAQAEAVAIPINVPFPSLDDLAKVAGAAGLIASIPALATLVHAITTEAGLGDASCRAKNKAICGVDSSAWANLLGGLAVVGFAFSLDDLYAVARPLVSDFAAVIEQAA